MTPFFTKSFGVYIIKEPQFKPLQKRKKRIFLDCLKNFWF